MNAGQQNKEALIVVTQMSIIRSRLLRRMPAGILVLALSWWGVGVGFPVLKLSVGETLEIGRAPACTLSGAGAK